jgi:hypothetical protein
MAGRVAAQRATEPPVRATAGGGRGPAALSELQAQADRSSRVLGLGGLQRAATQRVAGGVIQRQHNSVKSKGVSSAVSMHHPDWVKGSSDNKMTVWQIAEDAAWDFHFTAMYESQGKDCTKFHFTIRRKTGSKGDDAFAWFSFQGHNTQAALGARGDAGKTTYWQAGHLDFNGITPAISGLFANINAWAAVIGATAAMKST